MTRWLRAHPVAGYALLAFGFSYVVGFPVLMLGSGLLPPSWHLARAYLPRIGVTYGPAVAALVLAGITRAPVGPRELLRGALPRARDLPAALGIAIVGALAAGAALVAAGYPATEQLEAVRSHGGLLAAHVALQVAFIALGEELGWRGWLLPTLAARTTRLRASLAVGALWGLWHGPALLQGIARGAMLVVGTLGLSVLFTALWARAGRRPFVAVVAHAMVNAPLYFWEDVAPASADPRLGTALSVLFGGYALAALLLVAATRRWWTEGSSDGSSGAAPSTRFARSG